MNNIHRLIWNALTQTWVAVAEVSCARGKGDRAGVNSPGVNLAGVVGSDHQPASGPGFKLTALALCLIPIYTLPAWAQTLPSNALPTGGQVTAGTASITQTVNQTTNVLTVNQASQRAALDWQTFNIGSAATVNFVQPNASAVALNRIVGNSASEIYGKLNANGSVFFSNPAGMLFGAGAQVNVGSLMATTLNISNSDDFVAGRTNTLNLNGGAGNTGLIRNEGLIQAINGAALVGNSVQNAGQIIATTATLAAGNTVALDLTGDGLIRVRVTDPSLQAAIENSGSITATQAVTLTAGQAKSAISSVVNNSGTIRATGLISRGGEIYLEGPKVKNTGLLEARTPAPNPDTPGTPSTPGSIMLMGNMENGSVEVGGTLDASAPVGGNGGFIETSAAVVNVADDAKITTAAANGTTGKWLIDPYNFIVAASGGNITGTLLSTLLGSNSVTIQTTNGTSTTTNLYTATSGTGDVNVNDTVTWADNKLTLKAHNNININAFLIGTGDARLAFEYGQASESGGSSKYNINVAITLPSGANRFSTKLGSEGSTLSYTVINSLPDLQNIGLSGNYALGSTLIAPTNNNFVPIGTDSMNAFNGRFDGLGNTISALNINRPNDDNVGLFGYVGSTGKISNVSVTDATVAGKSNVGVLAGYNLGSISNLVTSGVVTGNSLVSGGGNFIGGLVGINNGGSIWGAQSTVNVSGSSHIGGLVGLNQDGAISNSRAVGTVTGGTDYVGGLVGFNNRSLSAPSITNSFATGNVSGGSYVGGLAGVNYGTISGSFASGSVSGDDNVGGLVGQNGDASIANSEITASYATGSVSGAYHVGGLVGLNTGNSTVVSNSYATGNVTGRNEVGGLVGENWGGGTPTITRSYATGKVLAVGAASSGTDQNSIVGGLVGANAGNISESFATGSVSFSRTASTNNAYLGGLVGSSSGSVSDSFALGNVYGNWFGTNPGNGFSAAGGLVGSSNSNISNSFATGYVTANNYKGGVLGMNNLATVTNSFWNTETSGIAANTATTGTNSPTLGTGKTTAQLMDSTSPVLTSTATSGTSSTWVMNTSNGVQYPWLRSTLGATGPQTISGTIANIGTTSQITQVNLAINGTFLGKGALGANGFSYGIMAPGTISANDVLLLWTDTVFNSTAKQAGMVVKASGGNMTGLDGVANALTVRNHSNSALSNGDLVSAKGSLSNSRGVIPYDVTSNAYNTLSLGRSSVSKLLVTGTGSVSLVDSGSNIATLAASMNGGSLSYANDNSSADLNVGTVGSVSGIDSIVAITLNIAGRLSQSLGEVNTINALTAPAINLTTGTGMGTGNGTTKTPIDPIRIATNNLSASTSSGDIWLVNTPTAAVTLSSLNNASSGTSYYSQIGQALNITGNITSNGGSITIDPPTSIAMAAGTSINSNGGAIDLQATGAMTLTNVNAGGGAVTIQTPGPVTASTPIANATLSGGGSLTNGTNNTNTNTTTNTNTSTTNTSTSTQSAITTAISSVLSSTSTTSTASTTNSAGASSTDRNAGTSGNNSSGSGTGSTSTEKRSESAPAVIKTVSVAGNSVTKPADQIVTPFSKKGTQLMCRRTT